MATETAAMYFDARGPENTDAALRLAKARADALGIQDIVVVLTASYTGETGARASELFRGGDRSNLIVIAGVYGFREPNQVAMLPENRARIEANGGKILFTGHA